MDHQQSIVIVSDRGRQCTVSRSSLHEWNQPLLDQSWFVRFEGLPRSWFISFLQQSSNQPYRKSLPIQRRSQWRDFLLGADEQHSWSSVSVSQFIWKLFSLNRVEMCLSTSFISSPKSLSISVLIATLMSSNVSPREDVPSLQHCN